MFFKKLTNSKILFIILFLIPAVAFLVGLEWTLINLLLVVATELTLAHAMYAGYIMLKQQEKMNFLQYSLLGSIWIVMLIFFSNWENITKWFFILIAVLVIGIVFNLYTKYASKQEHIKEFCKTKTYVDIVGLVLGICGVVFIKLAQKDLFLAIVNLGTIVFINYFVFFKIRLFDKLKCRE
jgi:hypothetical protein